MRASRLLLGVVAPGLLRPASALDVSRLPPSGAREARHRLTDAELVAAGKDADEEDDFDTWFLEQESVTTGPEKHPPSKEEYSVIAQAQLSCGISPNSTGPASKPSLENAVITYLVTRPSDLIRLKESMPRLWYYFLQHQPYPVKVFIPGDNLRKYDYWSYSDSPTYKDVSREMKEYAGFPVGYDFEIITFDVRFPAVITGSWESRMNGCAQAVSTSYKHMNQFFTKVMYEHKSLKKYRYYLRVDADFNFLAPLAHDPFCMMAKTGRKFMWQTRKTIGDVRCSEGLWEWFQDYQQSHGLTPADPIFFKAKGARVNYVGYAGMGDLEFFRSKPVRELAKALNEDGRVYLNRWSDQTYYPLLFGLFANHSAVGDIGFGWPEKTWCHKCPMPAPGRRFDPATGQIREAQA